MIFKANHQPWSTQFCACCTAEFGLASACLFTLLTTLFCGCDRSSRTVAPAGGPRRPFPDNPVLERLADARAIIDPNAPTKDQGRVTSINFAYKVVTREMLADVARVRAPVDLGFRNCEFDPAALGELNGMRSLYDLALFETRLDHTPLTGIHSLPGLRQLRIEAKGGAGCGLSFLTGSTHLKSVYLHGTAADNEDIASIANHAQLLYLDISGTRISDDGLQRLTRVPLLRSLIANNCAITDEGLANLGRLTTLQTLCLDGSRITDAGLVHLASLTELENLGLSQTEISDRGLAQLTRLPRLSALGINRTSVTDAGIANLAPSATLVGVDAYETRVTKAARKFLPKVSLWFDGSHDAHNNQIP